MSAWSRRNAAIALAAIAAAVLVTAAGAFWTTNGLGSGSADARTPDPVSLSPATPTEELYPGETGDVALVVANPNPHSVFVGSLALDASQGDGGFAVDGAHAGCDTAALSFTTQTNAGAGWTVSAGSSTSVVLADAVELSTTAASACQGATFTVYLEAGL